MTRRHYEKCEGFKRHNWIKTFYRHRWYTFCANCGIMFKHTKRPWFGVRQQ